MARVSARWARQSGIGLTTMCSPWLKFQDHFWRHRNIVRLLGLSWDVIEEDSLYAPLMIVELAWKKAPTLRHYFGSYTVKGAHHSLSDCRYRGWSVRFSISQMSLHADIKPENILLVRAGCGRTGEPGCQDWRLRVRKHRQAA